ncbi:MAG: HAD family phosphatase, partial [Verrucomicrobiaceae bacterium]
MHTSNENTSIRLAAIDLDGTLLGPDSRISPENLSAVDQLTRAGIEVVFASGRHFKSAGRRGPASRLHRAKASFGAAKLVDAG